MTLDVGFGWRSAKAANVFRNEHEVFNLSLGGSLTGAFRRRCLWFVDRNLEWFGIRSNHNIEPTREANSQTLHSVNGGVRYSLTRKGLSERFGTESVRSHKDWFV